MSDSQIPAGMPPGTKVLSLGAKDIDYLCERFEIRDHRDVIGWAVRLLADIARLDEGGWCLTFQKLSIDPDTKKVTYSTTHNPIHAKLEWLTPSSEGFARFPSVEVLEERQKIKS